MIGGASGPQAPLLASPNMKLAKRRDISRAVLLLAPALLFLGVCFVYPVFNMLTNSFYDDSASSVFPRTAGALRDWGGDGLPEESAMVTFLEELRNSQEQDRAALASAVRRMNFDEAGFRSLMRKTARLARNFEGRHAREALIAADRSWENPDVWAVVKRSTRAVTPFYLVRRGKASSPCGCESRPASVAPAGSNRSG